jgi:hypothetical protein
MRRFGVPLHRERMKSLVGRRGGVRSRVVTGVERVARVDLVEGVGAVAGTVAESHSAGIVPTVTEECRSVSGARALEVVEIRIEVTVSSETLVELGVVSLWLLVGVQVNCAVRVEGSVVLAFLIIS